LFKIAIHSTSWHFHVIIQITELFLIKGYLLNHKERWEVDTFVM
jgi:hypothetical protein